MPKTLSITTRKIPYGDSFKIQDHFLMRTHKQLIDLHSPSETVKQITPTNTEPGEETEVTTADA